MKDPRPLVDHCYVMCIEDYLNQIITGDGIYPPSINLDLFKSLYTESSVELPGDPLHNNNINYYDHEDTTPIFVPSQLYVFRYLRENIVWNTEPQQYNEELPECAMVIFRPEREVTKRLLTVCHRISTYQAVQDLYMADVDCAYSPCQDVLIITLGNPRSVTYKRNSLPGIFVLNILRQLFDCGESLQKLWVNGGINLKRLEFILNKLMKNLVDHHKESLDQRKLRLWLGDDLTNNWLSARFVDKWMNQCDGIESIDCTIVADGEFGPRGHCNINFCSYLCLLCCPWKRV